MVQAGAWDGIGSSIVGGLIGAVTVMLGAWLAYRLSERSRRADREHEGRTRAAEDRRNAAKDLIIQISNLKDDATSHRSGLLGDYALFPLRNALFVTHVALERYPAYVEVQQFYRTVTTWREWARDHEPANPPSTRRPDDEYAQLRSFQAALQTYADDVISLLQDHREDEVLSFQRPDLPRLPQ